MSRIITRITPLTGMLGILVDLDMTRSRSKILKKYHRFLAVWSNFCTYRRPLWILKYVKFGTPALPNNVSLKSFSFRQVLTTRAVTRILPGYSRDRIPGYSRASEKSYWFIVSVEWKVLLNLRVGARFVRDVTYP